MTQASVADLSCESRISIGIRQLGCKRRDFIRSTRAESCRAKICNLEIVIGIEKQVFRLQITMTYLVAMAKLKSIHHLEEEVACHWLTELS